MNESDPRRWLMLATLLSATFMSGFDANAVNVALPSLHRELGAGSAALELVIGGYLFTYASFLITSGRLGDIFGHRRLFMAGMAGFAVTSLLCGLAQSSSQLVVARLLQGATAAAMVPQVIALIAATFPAKDRARAFSWLGVVIGVAGVCGQVLGGVLLDANLFGWTWRPIFFVNVPIGAVTLVLAARLIPSVGPSAQRPKLDPGGAVLISGALALALVPLSIGRQEGWPAWAWACLAAAVPALALALWWERRQTAPLVNLALFRRRSLNIGLLMYVAFMSFFVSMTFALSLLLQSGLGLSPLRAGLTFAPFALLAMVAALFSQKVTALLGQRALTVGALLSSLGMFGLGLEMVVLHGGITAWWMQLPLCVIGLGNGLMLPLFVGVTMSDVRPTEAGSASGLLTTTQQFSGALGLAAMGAVFFAVLGSRTSADGYASSAASVMWIGMGLLLVLAALTLTIPVHRPEPAERSEIREPEPEPEREPAPEPSEAVV
jgi:EmrB/QacA subfamily drug resistance transporter